jgi:hypothetical protein
VDAGLELAVCLLFDIDGPWLCIMLSILNPDCATDDSGVALLLSWLGAGEGRPSAFWTVPVACIAGVLLGHGVGRGGSACCGTFCCVYGLGGSG